MCHINNILVYCRTFICGIANIHLIWEFLSFSIFIRFVFSFLFLFFCSRVVFLWTFSFFHFSRYLYFEFRFRTNFCEFPLIIIVRHFLDNFTYVKWKTKNKNTHSTAQSSTSSQKFKIKYEQMRASNCLNINKWKWIEIIICLQSRTRYKKKRQAANSKQCLLLWHPPASPVLIVCTRHRCFFTFCHIFHFHIIASRWPKPMAFYRILSFHEQMKFK